MGRRLNPSDIIDYDEKYATVSALAGATTEIFKFQVKPGKQPYLSFIGNGVQAGGAPYLTFKFQVNRSDYYPYDGSLNQWADPTSNIDLPVSFDLPVGCEVRVIVINSDGSNPYDATARVRIVYADFNKPDIYK